jgi:hypothetical protein
MSFGFSKFGVCAATTLLVCSSLTVPRVEAQGQQKPRRFIELSETNSAEILTNLNRITARKEGVDQLEDQLRVVRSLTPKNLEARFNAPYNTPTAIPRKTLMELLDRQKNWGLTAEELGTANASSESDLLSTYGTEKFDSKSSSLQQFYEGLNRSGAGRQKQNGLSDKEGSNGITKRSEMSSDDYFADDAKLPPGLRDKAQKLRELVNEDPDSMFSRSKPRASFENFFGLNKANPAADAEQGAKNSTESFVDQFKKVLDGGTSGVKLDSGLDALVNGATAARSALNPSIEPLITPAAHHDLFTETPTPGTFNSVAHPTTVPDLNAALLNHWNPLYSPPKIEPPKITPPTPPNFDFPRRRF